MKLIPKAKPVRIRIKSDGKECTDLDDLLSSFDVDDLMSIERRQLVKWLNQVDGGSVIAKKLEGVGTTTNDANALKLYQIFFGLNDNFELYRIEKVIEEKSYEGRKWAKSARRLWERLIREGDNNAIKDEFEQDKTGEKIWQFVSNKINKDAVCNNGAFFLDKAKRIYQIANQQQSNIPSLLSMKIIGKLQEYGIDGAKDFIQKYGKLTPQDIMSLIDSFFTTEYKDSEEAIMTNLGVKANKMPPNLKDFLDGVYLGIANKNFTDAIKKLGINNGLSNSIRDNLSSERLFLYVLFRVRCYKYSYTEENTIRYLVGDRNYQFAFPLMKGYGIVTCSKLLPSDIVTKENGWCKYGGYIFRNLTDKYMDFSIFRSFMRIYFRHFLEPQYFNGDLSTI